MRQEPESSKPIVERLLPQTSIRFFVFLIGVSALVMYTFRAALVGDEFWAKCASVVIATTIGCFVVYMLLFLVANLFSLATATLVDLPSRPGADAARGDLGDGLTSTEVMLTEADAAVFDDVSDLNDESSGPTESR